MSSYIFEATMLVCFGAAWPLAILKSYRSRQIGGKSLPFLVVVMIGYAAGVAHKLINEPDNRIVWLYAINGVMVSVDIMLYLRNYRIQARAMAATG
jgi:hypothetical protein